MDSDQKHRVSFRMTLSFCMNIWLPLSNYKTKKNNKAKEIKVKKGWKARGKVV